MRFNRLRLTGFKSFLEPTELLLDSGKTGIVGPNGCGKSNLVEAMRWVMGENSAKRMRGGEMDDVIFGGTGNRPARNIAEVSILIDNRDRRAPAAFNDVDDIEVSRRIERGSGSVYRVNGRDVRARDVQLLFADAATGPQSNSMVSQGKVGALINAKPAARRAILEDAAGIAGLHARRNEAEGRLRAADNNLTRLEDVIGALEGQLESLKKQAKQASRYRSISQRLRKAEAVVLYLRHLAATARCRTAGQAFEVAEREVAEKSRHAAETLRQSTEAAEVVPQLREAEAEAAAALRRHLLARDELDKEEERVTVASKEAAERLAQVVRDLERETTLGRDADAALARLAGEVESLRSAQQAETELLNGTESALKDAGTEEKEADARLTEATRALASAIAQRQQAERRAADADQLLTKRRQAREVAAGRHAAIVQEAEGLTDPAPLAERVNALEEDLESVRSQAEAAGTAAEEAEAAAASAKRAAGEAESALRRLDAEINGLEAALRKGGAGQLPSPLIEALQVPPGLEAAVAAALGADITASLEGDAGRRWEERSGPFDLAPLPEGARALPVVGPPALARRLAAIGLVEDDETARRLAPTLAAGQRLVTPEGKLWRWDGLVAEERETAAAEAVLEQRNHLAALAEERQSAAKDVEAAGGEADRLAVMAEEMRQKHREARRERDRLADELEKARKGLFSAREARDRLTGRLERAAAEQSAAAAAEAEAEEAYKAARSALEATEPSGALRAAEEEAQAAQAAARARVAEKRAEHDRLLRDARHRGERLVAIDIERRSWQGRKDGASGRLAELELRRSEIETQQAELARRPAEIAEARSQVLDLISAGEIARNQAADALATSETALREAEQAQRKAEAELAAAREARVRAEAQRDQANDALQAEVARIAERLECRPAALPSLAELQDVTDPSQLPELEGAEKALQRLSRERESLGAVNLRAEEEANELTEQVDGLKNERDDLLQAIARLRQGIGQLNREGRERLRMSFNEVDRHFRELFNKLFGGGSAHLELVEGEDPLDAGLEIFASPPGKKLQHLSLLSGGEQALTALALLFGVFLTNPSPICVLDEADAPLDDNNVDRFCNLLDEISERTGTRFLVITHHRMTMARMDRLFGVTMAERGVSQMVSVDLRRAEDLRESA